MCVRLKLKYKQHLCKYNDEVQSVKIHEKVLLIAESLSHSKWLCKWKGIEIIEGHMMSDHIHLLLSISLKYGVSQIIGYPKEKSAIMIFERHSNLKYKYGNRHFWAEGYYVSTVDLNTVTIQRYIREQEKEDQIMDKLKAKEYVGPFKGSK